MIFHHIPIAGAWVIEPERRGDARGWFARLYCEREMGEAGIDERFVQINHSASAEAATLRGMHYQLPPAAEAKVVRCVRGALWDALVDLRPDSPSYLQWHGLRLDSDNGLALYVPRGCAHGFITLEANTEALYLSSTFYVPETERGLCWNDPRFGIEWPQAPRTLSDKDAAWPAFDPEWHGVQLLNGLRDAEVAA